MKTNERTYLSSIKIPRDRIGVLVGQKGKIKRKIEAMGEVQLDVDSKGGDVEVYQVGDPLKSSRSINVVQAIARGFSPANAALLFSENEELVVIPLRDFAKPGSRRIEDIKGRIIGTKGSTRRIIEDLTSCKISVYGDTVSLIGDYLSLEASLKAVNMLINGSRHRTVYTFLEKNARQLRLQRIEESFG